MAGRSDPWVRWFDVTNPKKHSSGYTIYKVTSKIFPVHSPDTTTEVVVWKRYKDFLKLHKTLFLLHRNLHRPGVFPEFPKPQIFGRFDDTIIEERRLASLELLNFVGSQAHLFNSIAVQQFFETSESNEKEKPADNQEILQPVVSVSALPSVDNDELNQSVENNGSSSYEAGANSTAEVGGSLPEGDYLGERPEIDAVSQETVSSNAEDCVTSRSENGTAITSYNADGLTESLSGIWAYRHPDNSDSDHSDPELVHQQSPPIPSFHIDNSDLDLPDIMNEFDPCHGSNSPREGAGVSNSQLLSQCRSTEQMVEERDSQLQPPADTLGEYIQSKEDYLYKAVKQIRKAKKEENAGHYQIAFDYYKRTVALLLTGVQGDGDEARRSVVRRKTAEYLMYAEQLHNHYLDSSGTDSERWRQQSVPRHVARLRAGLSELANFKVLGLIGGNMLVLDKTSDETYVIKVLQKNTEVTEASWSNQVIPTRCTRMIKLVKYFETESTIYLLLEYAQGGTLWQYVHNYLQTPESSPTRPVADGADNIYSGKKYSTDDGTSQQEDSSAKDENECSQEYINMLLGIEPTSGQAENNSMGGHQSGDFKGVVTGVENSTNSTGLANSVGGTRVDNLMVNEIVDNVSAGVDNPSSSAGLNNAADDISAGLHNSTLEDSSPQSPTDEVFNADMTQSASTRRMSLRRSNSSKSRSVSVERASDSINSARHRNWSTVFDDLEESSRKPTKFSLPESCVQRWAAELLVAIHELHQAGLILRDLQPDNLLLNSRGHVVLTYFCRWPGIHQEIEKKSIDQLYVSPEGTLPGGLCMASDYWSFGVLLYELLTGVSLTSVHPGGITSHTILKTPEHLSKEAEHLLKQLLRHNWSERLGGGAAGIDEIKAHPFFQNVDWSTI